MAMLRPCCAPLMRVSRWNIMKLHVRAKLVNALEKLRRTWRRRRRRKTFNGLAPSARPQEAEEEAAVARVLVGPVIGLVTEHSARILLEVNKPARVRMSLHRMSKIEEEEEEESKEQEEEREANDHEQDDDERQTAVKAENAGQYRSFKSPSLSSSTAWTASLSSSSSRSTVEEEEGSAAMPLVVEKAMGERRACVFAFAGLEPGRRYRVQVEGCRELVPNASFRTFPLPSRMGPLRMASVSCNSIFITKRTIIDVSPVMPSSDLWAHLRKELPSLHLIVHLGDQIYGDGDKTLDAGAGKQRDKWSNRFKIGQGILQGAPVEAWPAMQEAICEKYREVYRDTWSHRDTAMCLANCPNMMIYDDHEIRDNWGDNPSDQERDTAEFFVARCAWLVTMEYQRQLYEDVDFSKAMDIKKDYHFHAIGKLGLLFLDIRASRTFHREEGESKPYLGSTQWQSIGEALKPDGLFRDVRVLVVCSPAPLVFLVPSITKLAGSSVHRLEDFKGHWSAHNMEQVEMIERLWEWKSSVNGREVLVLGGDVHCGGHSRILKGGKTLFYQLTTSAIANMPLPKTAYYAMRVAGQLGQINDQIIFSHFSWTRARNYGIIDIKFSNDQDKEKPEIIMQLIKGKNMRPIRLGKRISNMQEQSSNLAVSLRLFKQKLITI